MRALKTYPMQIGGVADHIHVLVNIPPSICVANLVRDVKIASSKWVQSEAKEIRGFSWQEGYGVFAVSDTHHALVQGYIQCQEEHHRQRSFKEEFLELLRKNGVVFDEKYLWV